MSEIINKWNEKWKARQIQLLFSELGEKERNFFKHLEIINVKEVEYMNEYCDEGCVFDRIIEVLHEGTTYYICEDYGYFFISPDENYDSADNWIDFFKPEKKTENPMNYNQQINTFLKAFEFVDFQHEYIKDETKKQIKEEEKEHIGDQCIGIEFNNYDNHYYKVLENGNKIPYKKEKRYTVELYHE